MFKTQIGRNYELFECYVKPQHLMTQVELWAEYAALAKAHPVLYRFHRPDFKGIRHLVDTGDLYLASFDTCPAAKTEWVFDLYGEIYGCTASCGREEYRLGRYWPVVEKNDAAIENWQSRNVTTIEKCRSCSYNVIWAADAVSSLPIITTSIFTHPIAAPSRNCLISASISTPKKFVPWPKIRLAQMILHRQK
jgi:uncharacterized protein